MTLSVRAVAVIICPLLSLACARPFTEEPQEGTDDPALDVIPHSGTAVDRSGIVLEPVTCKTGDQAASVGIGIDQNKATRVVVKLGRDKAAREIIASIGRVTQTGEAAVKIELEDLSVITLERDGDKGAIKLVDPVGREIVATCDAQEAVAVGAVARKLIAGP